MQESSSLSTGGADLSFSVTDNDFALRSPPGLPPPPPPRCPRGGGERSLKASGRLTVLQTLQGISVQLSKPRTCVAWAPGARATVQGSAPRPRPHAAALHLLARPSVRGGPPQPLQPWSWEPRVGFQCQWPVLRGPPRGGTPQGCAGGGWPRHSELLLQESSAGKGGIPPWGSLRQVVGGPATYRTASGVLLGPQSLKGEGFLTLA